MRRQHVGLADRGCDELGKALVVAPMQSGQPLDEAVRDLEQLAGSRRRADALLDLIAREAGEHREALSVLDGRKLLHVLIEPPDHGGGELGARRRVARQVESEGEGAKQLGLPALLSRLRANRRVERDRGHVERAMPSTRPSE